VVGCAAIREDARRARLGAFTDDANVVIHKEEHRDRQ
jgi:hypothetical protein